MVTFQKEIEEYDEKLILEVAQIFDDFMESNFSYPYMTHHDLRNSFNIVDKIVFNEVVYSMF